MPTIISGDTGIDKIAAGAIEKADLPTGSVLQVVSVTKTDTYSASVATGGYSGDVTGLSASITPTSSSSKILIFVNLTGGITAGIYNFAIYKNGSQLSGAIGTSAGSRLLITSSAANGGTGSQEGASFNYLDSPSTTSSTSYTVRLGHDTGATQTIYINQSKDDANAGYANRGASTITLLEVSA